MATERTRMMIAATLNGLPLMAQIEDFEPPNIAKVMEEARGGRFAPEQIMVGLEKLDAKLKVLGAGFPILIVAGVSIGDQVMLDVREAGKDLDGNSYSTWHSLGGEVVALTEDPVKMGQKPTTSLAFAPYRYTRLENAVPVIDINLRTQKINLGAGDIMEDIRRLVLMP